MSSKLTRTFHLASAVVLIVVASRESRAQVEILQIDGQTSSHLGYAVANVGDLDGDGVDDFIAGEPERNGPGTLGWAYVYSGKAGALIREHAAGAVDYFGQSVASLGDLDADGESDYAVGGMGLYDVSGTVVVYSGASGAELWSVTASADELLGKAIASAGDLDGDARPEVLISRAGSDVVGVYTADGNVLYTVSGQVGGLFGHSIAGLGDLDGDGAPEFAVGEPYYDEHPDRNIGRVRIFSGATGVLLKRSLGEVEGDAYGWSVSRGSDWDGDGHDDLVVGAPFVSTGLYAGYKVGKIRVLSSKKNVEIRSNLGTTFNDNLGTNVVGLHDVDLDGVGDYAASAPGWNEWLGQVRVFSGADDRLLARVDGEPQALGEFGRSMAAGDWNLDGVGDWLIGDSTYEPVNGVDGRVVVIAGCPPRIATYGSGWPGTNGIPSLDCTVPLAIGGLGEVQIGNSNDGLTLGVILVGFDAADLSTSADGRLLVVPVLELPFYVYGPTRRVWGPIPDDPALAFLDLFVQALEADPGASKGLSFTAGLKLTIGFEMQ